MKDQLSNILRHHNDIEVAILFGSHANGNTHADSDIDLAIQLSSPIDAETKTALISEIANEFAMPVDIVDIRSAGEPLLGEILKGEMLIGSQNERATLIYKHLIETADFVPLQQRLLKERREQWINS